MDMLIPEYHLGDTPDKEYYRKVYQDSKRITGKEDLTNKKVVVFMEVFEIYQYFKFKEL